MSPLDRTELRQLRDQLNRRAAGSGFSVFGVREVKGELEFGIEDTSKTHYGEFRVGFEIMEFSLSNGFDFMLGDADEDVSRNSYLLKLAIDAFSAFAAGDFVAGSNWLQQPRMLLTRGEYGGIEGKRSPRPFWYHADGPMIRARSGAVDPKSWPPLDQLDRLVRQASSNSTSQVRVVADARHHVDVHVSLPWSGRALRFSWRYEKSGGRATMYVGGDSFTWVGRSVRLSWGGLRDMVSDILDAGVRVTTRKWPVGSGGACRVEILKHSTALDFEVPARFKYAPTRSLTWRPQLPETPRP